MKYIPKKTDTPLRAVYAILFIFSLIPFIINKESNIKTIFMCIGLVTLSLALYFVTRLELTSYEYTIREEGNDFAFIINKFLGKRGNYVCYCMASDCVFFEIKTDKTKKELMEKYKKVNFYNFCQNVINKHEYVIVFNNQGTYDAIFFEPDESFAKIISEANLKAKKSETTNEND